MIFFNDISGNSYRKSDVRAMVFDPTASTKKKKLYRTAVNAIVENVWVDDQTRAEIEQYAGDQQAVLLPTDGQYELIESGRKAVRTPIVGWRVLGNSIKPLLATGEAVGEDFSIISTRNGLVWSTATVGALTMGDWEALGVI